MDKGQPTDFIIPHIRSNHTDGSGLYSKKAHQLLGEYAHRRSGKVINANEVVIVSGNFAVSAKARLLGDHAFIVSPEELEQFFLRLH